MDAGRLLKRSTERFENRFAGMVKIGARQDIDVERDLRGPGVHHQP